MVDPGSAEKAKLTAAHPFLKAGNRRMPKCRQGWRRWMIWQRIWDQSPIPRRNLRNYGAALKVTYRLNVFKNLMVLIFRQNCFD